MAKEGDTVTIVGKKHPHYGETGTVTDEYIKTTGQYIITLDDCMHGTINTAVSHDDIGEETPKLPVKMGRPTTYTKELSERFCQLIAEGNSLRKVCRMDGMPDGSTIFKWMREYGDFSKQYEAAKLERAEAFHEDLLDIADESTNDYVEDNEGSVRFNAEHVQRARLRIDTRKWLMSKMQPKKYGDKLDMTTDGKALPAPIFGGAAAKKEEED